MHTEPSQNYLIMMEAEKCAGIRAKIFLEEFGKNENVHDVMRYEINFLSSFKPTF
jgi:ABC-type phosphate transport system permease subunit